MDFDDQKLNELWASLTGLLRELAPLTVAFSGGVDSIFLLKAAVETLGKKAAAITVDSPVYPRFEIDEAAKLAKVIGAEHIVIKADQLSDPSFKENSPMRCYHCKKRLYSAILKKASALRHPTLIDGANADDEGDYRPGMQAAREMGVRSPLSELGITKEQIRAMSRVLGLPTACKPSYACLASRIPYGEEITTDKLLMVEKAESCLLAMGFRQARVRWHGAIARIEVASDEIARIFEAGNCSKAVEELKSIGFKYITLDLEGYRTGSLNEVIEK